MTSIYSELAERFRGEIEDIEQVVQRTLHHQPGTGKDGGIATSST